MKRKEIIKAVAFSIVFILFFIWTERCNAQVVFHHLDSNFSSVTKIEYKEDSLFVTVYPYEQPRGVPPGLYYRFSYIIRDKRLLLIDRKKYYVNQF